MIVNKNELLAKLRPFGQEHLLAFWEMLDAAQREKLNGQIAAIDFQRLQENLRTTKAGEDWSALARRAVGPPAIRLGRSDNRFSTVEAREVGEASLRAGRVGVILVAGGQGTRLGFDHPKGMFPIGPVSGATLFQILLEKVLASSRRYGATIPLYLMTSPATHDETIAYLNDHHRFGIPAHDLTVFCQGTMPAVDAESGKVLLAASDSLALSPDGHGGMPAALRASGALADIRRRAIEHLFYMQVDNPQVVACDPEFVGYHLVSESELSTKVVAKTTPRDRMGNVVSVDGRVRIIEYSDLPDDVAEQRLPDGSLKLWAGSTAMHVFEVDLLDRASRSSGALPYHLARKRVPYIDDRGELVDPVEANAIKFEQFIFDLLPAARNPIVVEVDEATEFAPVKNAPGAERDSPERVQAQMIALHRRWLQQAGASVAPGIAVEISPLFALDAEETARRITRDMAITSDRSLR
ncbi:MAG TPA: UDPGP type 1 family protein [Pirellulales bacterium]|nr:UDPGP type 1 family protein [Pirellulales bacterium]